MIHVQKIVIYIQFMLKNYLQKFNNLLKVKSSEYFLLIISLIIFLNWPIPKEIIYYYILLFYFSFILQSFLLLKSNYYLYVFRVFIIVFVYFEIIFKALIALLIFLNWPTQKELLIYFILFFCFSLILQKLLLLRNNYFLYVFRVFIIVFIYFEIIFGALNSKKIVTLTLANSEFLKQENFYLRDSIIGYRFLPNSIRKRSTEILRGDTLFDVNYSSDKFGRRISEDSIIADTISKNGFKKKHAIFLGCSFTFGLGLKFSSAFPSIFEDAHPEFKSYNYGFCGYGPHQNCLLFDNGANLINNYTVLEDSGICIYTFIGDHLNRVFGGSSYLGWASSITHDIYINNNMLEIKKRSDIQVQIAWFLNNSETMKYFNINFSYPRKETYYKRFADIVNYTAAKYWEIKPHGKFYVGLYPGCTFDTRWIWFLDKKIKILNVPTPIDFDSNPSYFIKMDGHPAKALNTYYERGISKLLFNNK